MQNDHAGSVFQMRDDLVGERDCAGRATQITGAVGGIAQGGFQRTFDCGGGSGETREALRAPHLIKQHCRRPDQRCGVGNIAARDVGGGAVLRLCHRSVFSCVQGGGQPKAAGQFRGKIN